MPWLVGWPEIDFGYEEINASSNEYRKFDSNCVREHRISGTYFFSACQILRLPRSNATIEFSTRNLSPAGNSLKMIHARGVKTAVRFGIYYDQKHRELRHFCGSVFM